MSAVMQQSSKAQDRSLGVWFQDVQQGRVKLPRFQRFEAWDRGRVTSFWNTIINNLPVGVTLALDVAGKEKFESRYIATAEPATPAGRLHEGNDQRRGIGGGFKTRDQHTQCPTKRAPRACWRPLPMCRTHARELAGIRGMS